MHSFFIGGFILMIAFVFTSVVCMSLYHGVMRPAQLLVGVAAIATPVLAFVTTFGVLAWLDFTFYPLMILAPYLILAIGAINIH
jgi:hypothetical protein